MADRVLLATADHPPSTERVARDLAEIESTDTTVSLVYVFDDADLESTRRNLNLDGRTVNADELASRKEDVVQAKSVLDDAGIDYEVVGKVEDDRATAVLDAAADANANRIYVYSEGRNPVGKAVFGSDLQDIIRWSTVPVIVTPDGAA